MVIIAYTESAERLVKNFVGANVFYILYLENGVVVL